MLATLSGTAASKRQRVSGRQAQPLQNISSCSGVGGITAGSMLSCPHHHAVAVSGMLAVTIKGELARTPACTGHQTLTLHTRMHTPVQARL